MKRSTLRLIPPPTALTAPVVAVAVVVAIELVVQVVAVVLLVLLLPSLAPPTSMSVIRPPSHPLLNPVFTKKIRAECIFFCLFHYFHELIP